MNRHTCLNILKFVNIIIIKNKKIIILIYFWLNKSYFGGASTKTIIVKLSGSHLNSIDGKCFSIYHFEGNNLVRVKTLEEDFINITKGS